MRLSSTSSSGIKRFLEGCDAQAAVSRKEGFIIVVAELQIGIDHRLDRIDDAVGTEARARDRGKRGVFRAGAAKQELIVLLAAFLHAQDADVTDMMVSAGVDAAGNLDLQVANLVLPRRQAL